MYQFEEVKNYNVKNFSRAITAILAVCGILILIFVLIKAKDLYYERRFSVQDAQKIGNWEFPNKDYIVEDLREVSIGGKKIQTVKVLDRKSGNTFLLFKEFFSGRDFLRVRDGAHDEILKQYKLDGAYIKYSDKLDKYGSDFHYNSVGWGSEDDAKAGIIGSLVCPKASGNISSTFVVAENSSAKYDNDRALEFLNTFKCNAPGELAEDRELNKEMDTDSDGLPDRVEKMLGTGSYNPDSDDDSYNDGNEIRNGYSPMKAGPSGKYAPDEFEKVKKDIQYLDPDAYKNLFEQAAPDPTPTPVPLLLAPTPIPAVTPQLSPTPTPSGSATILKMINLNNKDWAYSLYIPSGTNLDKPNPLVLGLHGSGGSAMDYISYWRETADKNGYIIAVLQAYDKKYPDGNVVQSYPWTEASDFTANVLRNIQKNYKIDDNKVYLTGYSTGALTSYIIAVSSGIKFKGIIPINGYLPLESGIVDKLINSKDQNFYVVHSSQGVTDKDMKAVVEQEKTLLQYGAKMTFKILSDIPSNEYPMAEQENIAKWMNSLP